MIKKIIIFFLAIIILNISICNLIAEEKFKIDATKIIYKDNSSIIIATGNVIFTDPENKIIETDKAIYNKKKEIITTFGNSKYYDNKNTITAENFEYDIKIKSIFAKGNVILTETTYDKDKNEKINKHYFKQIKYFEKTKKAYADNVTSKLEDSTTISADKAEIDENKKISKLFNANLTSCKEIINEKGDYCPSWSLNSKEVIHDKQKKTITHKNAILKIKNIPVFYTPYFNHPDPTVIRKSGFLAPSTNSNSNLGRSLKTPYYWSIAEDKDMTFYPSYFFDQHDFLETSYRQAFKNKGYLRIENGYTKGYKKLDEVGRTPGSRNYFFSDFNQNYGDELNKNLKIQIQHVSQENFLRVYKINRYLFKEDIRNLDSNINFSNFYGNEYFQIKTAIQKNLDTNGNNAYTYILPEGNYSYNKKIYKNLNTNFFSNFLFKNFSTNQNQAKINNTLNINTDQVILKSIGLGSFFKLNLSNNNIYNQNVLNEKENDKINNYLTVAVDNTLPFAKKFDNMTQIISPRIFAKYTTGKMQDSFTDDKILEYSDIFSLNRTNNLTKPETGFSVGQGLDYSISMKSKDDNEVFFKSEMGIGQVLRSTRNDQMPNSSSLNNTSSDYAGYLSLNLLGNDNNFLINKNKAAKFLDKYRNNKINLSYKFNLENDFSKLLRNNLSLDTSYNSIDANISFNEKNHHLGSERSIRGYFKKIINNNFYTSYDMKRNLMTDSLEYQNFLINLENDCLLISLGLNKSYYSDQDLLPTKALVLSVTLKPFGDSFAPDISSFVK